MKKAPVVKIEGSVAARTARLLREVDGVEVVDGDLGAGSSDVTLRFGGVVRPVHVEPKRYLNAATAWQLIRQSEGADDRYLLVVTDDATEEARGILERHAIGIVDGAGNAHLELPGLLLHIEGRRRTREPRQPGAIRLSGKAGLVAQALLLERERAWQINDLADRAGISNALVHGVLTRLAIERLVAVQGVGPARVRRVTDATALLDLWVEENADRAVERTTAFRLARTPQELVTVVAEGLGRAGISYAMTRAAAAMALAPFVTSVPTVDIWVESAVSPKAVARALGADLVAVGANLVLTQAPGDGPLAFRGDHEGTWLVNPMRLYYDLRQDPRRGREQADRLRQELIGF
ncbi:MAG: hypothetical protein WBU92_02400 [Candidatus Dormiibacterota bacterium]